jgi:hypothetical protein
VRLSDLFYRAFSEKSGLSAEEVRRRSPFPATLDRDLGDADTALIAECSDVVQGMIEDIMSRRGIPPVQKPPAN